MMSQVRVENDLLRATNGHLPMDESVNLVSGINEQQLKLYVRRYVNKYD
jgi:hypothetical protein